MLRRFANTLLQNLFDLEREETVGEVLFYRVFEIVVLYWTLAYAWQWGRYLERLGAVVLPLGIAEYVDITFLYENALGLVNAALITGMMLLGYLRRWRPAYLVALLLMHLQYVARFSQGKVGHGSIIIGMALLSIAAATLVFEHRRAVRRVALGLCVFFIGLAYTTAALSKLGGTGLNWSDGRHLWMWIQERTIDGFSATGLLETNGIQELTLGSHLLATAFLTTGVLLELFAWLMWFRRWRPLVCLLLIGMHLGIWSVMGLLFSPNTHLLFLLAVPWYQLLDHALIPLNAPLHDKLKVWSLGRT